jgi:hypothetical protein
MELYFYIKPYLYKTVCPDFNTENWIVNYSMSYVKVQRISEGICFGVILVPYGDSHWICCYYLHWMLFKCLSLSTFEFQFHTLSTTLDEMMIHWCGISFHIPKTEQGKWSLAHLLLLEFVFAVEYKFIPVFKQCNQNVCTTSKCKQYPHSRVGI